MNHKSLIATFFLIANYPLIHSSEHGPIDARSGSAKSPRLRTAAEIEDDRRHLDYDNSSSCNLPPATQPSPIRKPATKRSFAAIDADHPETPCSLVDSTLSESSDTDVVTMTAPAVAPHASHLPHGHDCVLCVIGEHASAITYLTKTARQQRRAQQRLERQLVEQTRAHEAKMREITQQLLALRSKIRPATIPTKPMPKRPATR